MGGREQGRVGRHRGWRGGSTGLAQCAGLASCRLLLPALQRRPQPTIHACLRQGRTAMQPQVDQSIPCLGPWHARHVGSSPGRAGPAPAACVGRGLISWRAGAPQAGGSMPPRTSISSSVGCSPSASAMASKPSRLRCRSSSSSRRLCTNWAACRARRGGRSSLARAPWMGVGVQTQGEIQEAQGCRPCGRQLLRGVVAACLVRCTPEGGSADRSGPRGQAVSSTRGCELADSPPTASAPRARARHPPALAWPAAAPSGSPSPPGSAAG